MKKKKSIKDLNAKKSIQILNQQGKRLKGGGIPNWIDI